jgi:hypothetical protein
MRQSVIVQFQPDRPLELPMRADEAAMPREDARRWLDEQFVANDCEPLRASGKILTADKVLALAQAAGERRFADDAIWAHSFALAALSALGRPMVVVDVAAGTISF